MDCNLIIAVIDIEKKKNLHSFIRETFEATTYIVKTKVYIIVVLCYIFHIQQHRSKLKETINFVQRQ